MDSKEKFLQVKKLSYDLKVLYAEDEKDIRESTSELLKLFFKDIKVAVDGTDAKDKLKNFTPDILITDIQMPNLDGLELISYVKNSYEDLQVVITTAFSNQDYIFKSFDLGVSQYLIKPIKKESLINVIEQVSKNIDNSKKAKELEELKVHQMINYASEHVTYQILDSLKSPCLIFTNEKIRYTNRAYKYLAGVKYIDELFDKKEGYISSLKEYDETKPANNIVSISNEKGRKVYKIIKNNINIDDIVQKSEIYFFIDVTLEEYQKIKIKSYTEILETIVFKAKYQKKEPESKKIDVEEICELESKTKLTINSDENNLLRRSHTHKTTAQEYVSELDDDILSELQELDELDKDFTESISILREEANINGLKEMATQLQKYAHEISLLFEFQDLAYAIESLSRLFYTLDESKDYDKKINKVLILLEGIKEDLSTWRNVIFIEQSALDIHYLDSSLYSACLQIELVLSDEIDEMESDEDDLVLF